MKFYCNTCRQHKNAAEFYPSSHSQCKACKKAVQKTLYFCRHCGEYKPTRAFYADRKTECATCKTAKMRDHRKKTKQYLVNVTCPHCGETRQVSQAYHDSKRFSTCCKKCAGIKAAGVVRKNRREKQILVPCGGVMVECKQSTIPWSSRCMRNADAECEHYWECLCTAAEERFDGWRVA